MKFTSKIALALIASTTAGIAAYPMTAAANPVTGSTAAAVSIKFQKSGASGGFSIAPGSNATGGGTGVQELSAAVATGETSATANAHSTHQGTSANANGYSAPVYFSYETHNDVTKSNISAENVTKSEFKAQAAIEFAANQKTSNSHYSSETEKINVTTKGHKLTNLSKEEIEVAKSKATSAANLKLVASAEASAAQSASSKNATQSTQSEVGTSYEYSGSSAGLKYLPALVK
jgi:hypothetical protein